MPTKKLSASDKEFLAFAKRFEKQVRNVPDFPKPGILFKDITTVLKNKRLFAETVEQLAKQYKGKKIDKIVSVESRGFIFGAALAYQLGAGFVPVRKPNKLPAETLREEYALEYGTDRIEVQDGLVPPGARVVVVDDLLATGGTMAAGITLLRRVGAVVPAAAALIELTFLGGRARLDVPFDSLVTYDQ
jgi:adenine phosphoribosyltransferase